MTKDVWAGARSWWRRGGAVAAVLVAAVFAALMGLAALLGPLVYADDDDLIGNSPDLSAYAGIRAGMGGSFDGGAGGVGGFGRAPGTAGDGGTGDPYAIAGLLGGYHNG